MSFSTFKYFYVILASMFLFPAAGFAARDDALAAWQPKFDPSGAEIYLPCLKCGLILEIAGEWNLAIKIPQSRFG